ncbi:MAG: hypothetical protein HC918_07485 [Oscillatoriales cyanobacterium SM2_1_8]|nr:hypothetical protein [Oscillatoriales cyanobacterium SM2_1_8]
MLTIASPAARVKEGGNFVFTFSLDADPTFAPILEYEILGVGTMPATVAGQTSDINIGTFAISGRTATLTINSFDDSVFEGDEQFEVRFLDNSLYTLSGLSAFTFTIEDNEPVVSIEQVQDAAEPSTNGTFRLSVMNPIPSGGIAVPFSIGAPSIEPPSMVAAATVEDFKLLFREQVFSITAGVFSVPESTNSSSNFTVTISVADDFIAEGDEVFTVTLGAGGEPRFGLGTSVATATITDNDAVPIATIRATGMPAETGTQSPFTEASTPGTFVVELTDGMMNSVPALQDGATVSFTVAGTADTRALYNLSLSESYNFSYVQATGVGSVRIPQGQSMANIVAAPVDDEIVNIPPRTIDFQLTGGLGTSPTLPVASGYVLGSQNMAALVIQDNDVFPTATVLAGAMSVQEALNAGVQIPVTLSNSAQFPTTVSYTVGGTATNGVDFFALPGTLVIDQGQSLGVIDVAITDDFIDEGDETFVVNLVGGGGVSGYTLGANSSPVTVTITDIDTAGISVNPTQILTSEAGTAGTFAIALDSQPTATVTVDLTGLVATQGTLSTQALTFNATNWDQAQTVTVTGVDNDDATPNPPYTLTLAPSSGDGKYGGLTNLPTVQVTNQDNDGFGVSIGSLMGNVAEGATTAASYTLNLNRATSSEVTFRVSGGEQLEVSTSSSGPFSRSVDFSKSDTSLQTIYVRAVNDQKIEGDHSGTLTHEVFATNDPNYSGIKISNLEVNILDNDLPQIRVAATRNASEQSQVQGRFELLLVDPNDIDPATMSPRPVPAPNNITFGYTVGGNAQVPADYSILGLTGNTGTGVIAKGDTQINVLVNPVNDFMSELNEDVIFTLNSGTAYAVGTPNIGTVRITDDDVVGVDIVGSNLLWKKGAPILLSKFASPVSLAYRSPSPQIRLPT